MMRPLLTAFALTLLAGPASAMCRESGLDAWPPLKTALPLRPMIVIEGYAIDQVLVAGLGTSTRAELRADDHVVALKVEARHTGQQHVTQAVMRPARRLAAHTRYALFIIRESGHEQALTVWTEGGREAIAWTTGGRSDDVPPKWTAPPSPAGDKYMPWGCGPEVTVFIATPVVDDGATAIRVELREEGIRGEQSAKGQMVRYILFPREGEVEVGHGMCSGAFDVTGADRAFVAEMTALDASGNEAGAPALVRFRGVDDGRRIVD